MSSSLLLNYWEKYQESASIKKPFPAFNMAATSERVIDYLPWILKEMTFFSGGNERFRIFRVVVLPYMESARLSEGREGRASEKKKKKPWKKISIQGGGARFYRNTWSLKGRKKKEKVVEEYGGKEEKIMEADRQSSGFSKRKTQFSNKFSFDVFAETSTYSITANVNVNEGLCSAFYSLYLSRSVRDG